MAQSKSSENQWQYSNIAANKCSDWARTIGQKRVSASWCAKLEDTIQKSGGRLFYKLSALGQRCYMYFLFYFLNHKSNTYYAFSVLLYHEKLQSNLKQSLQHFFFLFGNSNYVGLAFHCTLSSVLLSINYPPQLKKGQQHQFPWQPSCWSHGCISIEAKALVWHI